MSRQGKKRTANEAAAAQQEQSDSRLELDVITGSLWQPTCQALDPVPSKIPLVFEHESHYRRTFQPLLLEEARGSLRAEFDEAMMCSRGWPVTITRCAPAKDGAFHLTLRPGDWGHAVTLKEGAIVVLIRPSSEGQSGGGETGGQPQSGGPGPPGALGLANLATLARAAALAGRWHQPGGSGGNPSGDTVSPILAAMVRMRCRDAGQALVVSVRPCCGHEAHREDGSPCNRALHLMMSSGVSTEADDGSLDIPSAGAAVGAAVSTSGGAGGTRSEAQSISSSGPLWLWLVPLTSLITNVRELRVLQRLGDIALLQELLRPSSFGSAGAVELPQVWPQDARHDPYYKYLYSHYDVPQREAIVAAAAHLATAEDLLEAEAQGVATGSGIVGTGLLPTAAQSSAGSSKLTTPLVPPITLVQGPPGTGKTHTVRGILNTWHSIMYHRHHTAWLHRARDILTHYGHGGSAAISTMLDMYCNSGGIGNGGDGGLLEALSQTPLDAPKPRILVCAPSNAAIDELLDRILTDGFCDFGGAMYRPNVVRVGAEEAPLSDAVKAVWTEAMINRYEAMGAESWAMAYKDCEARVANCNVYMASMATKLASKGAVAAAAEEADGGQELDRMAAELVRLNDHLNRAREEMARLNRMGDVATSGNSRLTGYVVRRVREDLELSLMEEAEMVFTTLSSTGRVVFSRLARGFDFVLIDEAAQASEIAALQPLLYGCRRLALVGDPQQLPATLFSAAAKETLLERSLFERLAQAGVAIKMLSVQYRMHPEIRMFPSSFFYNNRLEDGESVIRSVQHPPLFYATDLLKPYVVYDVSAGREMLKGRSRSNELEAELALGLYMELLATVRGDTGIGAAAMEAAATAVTAAAAASGGRGRQETTPSVGRAASVECSVGGGVGGGGGDPGVSGSAAAAAQQPFAFLERYTLNVTVGVITPYRAQRELIRRKFAEALGPGVLDAVRIETVDSFQGKQLDVIILSCVRTNRPGAPPPAANGAGVGFLADVRRMNVAITRAKQALWVLGQFSALKREPSWAALISDAEERGCIIEDANAIELCPQWEAYLERQKAIRTQQQLLQEQQAAAATSTVATAGAVGPQQRFGVGPAHVPVSSGGPPPPGFVVGPGAGPGPGSGSGQLQYEQLLPPAAPPERSQAPLQAPLPAAVMSGRLLQQTLGPPPAPGPLLQPGPEMAPAPAGPDAREPLLVQAQQLGGSLGLVPHPPSRGGAGRAGSGRRGHQRPRSLNQMQFRNHRTQSQTFASQQQHSPTAASVTAYQGAGRGRGRLISMMPTHARGGSQQPSPGRGPGRGGALEPGTAGAPEQ